MSRVTEICHSNNFPKIKKIQDQDIAISTSMCKEVTLVTLEEWFS
jgi:hypothetical protein